MNKDDIKSAVSIEFALSIAKAGKIVDSIFDVIADSFRKNKNIELQKFGKINIVMEKDSENKQKKLIFIPSKKLARRVNYNFENLKKEKIKLDGNEFNNDVKDEFSFSMSDEFIKELNKKTDETLEIIVESNDEELKINTDQTTKSVGRQLIPDNLVRLHKEIIKDETKESEKNNLWG